MAHKALALGLLTLACPLVSGCGAFLAAGPAPSPTPTALPSATPIPTPGVAAQIRRAERIGPGFLNYCPRAEGRNQAQFDVMLPGTGPVGGWCQTHISRQPGGDIISFYAHWDARGVRHGQGTMIFTYAVSRSVTPFSTPAARMVEQSGPLPP